MHGTVDFLLRHGYVVLMAWVFGEQIGLPMPTIPLFLAAGALAGAGRMNIWTALAISVFASIVADFIWYQLGKREGIRVLQWLCKISLEPDSCVRRTEGVFSRQGAVALVYAKFFPGLSTIAPPLAGVFHMSIPRFLIYDGAGSLIWAGAFLALGYIFTDEIEDIAHHVAFLGSWLLVIIVAAFAGYILWKYIARRRFLRELRVSRLTVEELKQKLDAGERPVIVDLRHELDFEADPEIIPGAFRMDTQELRESNDALPRDREIILYCTCPNEATSAQMAILLRRQGIQRIRPLQGGLDAWRQRGYAVDRPAPSPAK
jgi:membrane protein DedA with SNARE-associated domain/rhodanese-related sulfurtransferase